MRHRLSATTATLAAALVLTACADSTAPTASGDLDLAQVAADVAVAAGDAAAEDVEVFRTGLGALGLPTVDTERLRAWTPCPFDVAAQRNVCAPATRGPFTAQRSYRFTSASGVVQPEYSPLATATANVRWRIDGDITRERFAQSSTREREVTFSGLVGAQTQVTVNGTGSQTRARTRVARAGAAERSYEMSATQRITEVVVPVGTTPRWPLSGTITRDVTATWTGPAGTRTVTSTAVVTFDGTGTAALVVDGRRFTVDLATGAVSAATGA